MSFVGVILVVSEGDLSSVLSHPEAFGPDTPLLFGALCWVIYTSGAACFLTWSPIKYTAITMALGLVSAVVLTSSPDS
ncbi:hypothetical protein [Streptomyces violaceusniger]|uniref:hypothetical protein n=1 Tax=Streptomyces violaceusniger TaxID=68280 RepID=UPI003697E0E2